MAASGASLLAVALALAAAGDERGSERTLLIGVAAVTIVLSWNVVNTVFTLHYAHLYYGARDATIASDRRCDRLRR